jgi:amino acid adenylation domain-containing protein
VLARRLVEASQQYPERVALVCEGEEIAYGGLFQSAGRVARAIRESDSMGVNPLGAVFGYRTRGAYEAVLGVLLAGKGYVPLNPKFPAARNAHMLDVSGATALVVDATCEPHLADILAGVSRELYVLFTDEADVSSWQERFPGHRFHRASRGDSLAHAPAPPGEDASDLAYLLFTSGSTGLPKGVMVSSANVLAFTDAIRDDLALVPDDRFSQTFDLTFDLSAFDMFACWLSGGSLHVLPSAELLLPDEFIAEHALTVWFSVPSTAIFLRQLDRLKPDAFGSLRWSLFCGERLPATAAMAWQAAAPRSRLYNLYGPTEVTIACTKYLFVGADSKCVDGVVAIGQPLAGMEGAVVDTGLERVRPGERGELCMKGPQVAIGYHRDEERTKQQFVRMAWDDGPSNRWYRTGDVVYQDAAGDLIHCGRSDSQVKLRGYRIELAEVEHAVRRASGTDFVAVLPFPSDERGPVALTAVIARSSRTEEAILDEVRQALPDYMVPRDLVFIDDMPLGASGKIDRPALLEALRAGSIRTA